MKIAITADLHLTNPATHPGRYHVFEVILNQMLARGIEKLIIAGDLFDETGTTYADFEEICRRTEYAAIEIHVIPGNHDPNLKRSQFALGKEVSLHVHTEPTVLRPDPAGPAFLFLPYEKNCTIGERIADKNSELPVGDWVIVAHGDWLEGMRSPNPAEDGTYMPLTRKDLEIFHPAKVFLGHIHMPWEREPVYYPGSPCGLDITETGPRSFLIFDTTSRKVERIRLETDIVFCDASLVVLPLPNELDRVRTQLAKMLEDLETPDRSKITIRLNLCGGSTNKEELVHVLDQSLEGCVLYSGESPDLKNVKIAESSDIAALAKAVTEKINNMSWDLGPVGPSRDEILTAAFQTIYGG